MLKKMGPGIAKDCKLSEKNEYFEYLEYYNIYK